MAKGSLGTEGNIQKQDMRVQQAFGELEGV